jgi:hypothetical protein
MNVMGRPSRRLRPTGRGQGAYEILAGVAHSYHAVITYGELAKEVQKASACRPLCPCAAGSARSCSWWGHRAHEHGDPPLTSLVVYSTNGKVGGGYSGSPCLPGGSSGRRLREWNDARTGPCLRSAAPPARRTSAKRAAH